MKRWKRLGVFASFAILALILSAVLVIAACGGDEDEAEPTAAAVIETPPAPATVAPVSTTAPATAVPEVMIKEGTIPGSVLTVALETVGNLTTEPNADIPVYGCRPGCLLMKDDMFTMDRVGNLVGHVDQGSGTSAPTPRAGPSRCRTRSSSSMVGPPLSTT